MLDASALLTHLSLSLSLCSQLFSAENGAPTDFLAGRRRARGCGFCRSVLVCRLGKAGPDFLSIGPAQRVYRLKGNLRILRRFERRCHCPSLVVAFEEAPVRVPSRAGVVCAERRGLIGPGSRRSPSLTRAKRCPEGRVGAREACPGERPVDGGCPRRVVALARDAAGGAEGDLFYSSAGLFLSYSGAWPASTGRRPRAFQGLLMTTPERRSSE